jgi:hypothetical protein
MQKRLKSLFGALLVASLLASCFVSARADVNTQPVPFSFTAASGTSPQVGCSGANLAVITITSGGGATLTVKGSSDAVIGGTYLTNTAFGTNGVITAPGSSTQWPGSTAVYPVGFEFTYTGNSGTLAGSMVCSAAAGVASASGGASTVTCATPGCNVIVTNATTAPFGSAQPVTIASTAPVHDAAPVQPSPLYTMPVTTPAPAPTISPGLYTGTTIACPSAAPAAVNATYTCVHDASGFESVGGPCTGQLPFVSIALVTGAALNLAIALSAGKRILVCSVDGYVAGTSSSSWVLYYSTSSTCASGNTLLWVGADSGFSTTQEGFNKAFFSPLATPSGDSLCYAYNGTALTQTFISIQYVQLP